ncbi:peptidoglycan DD-metalloendopeptidase family protein [Streptomyces sp. NPDC054796]
MSHVAARWGRPGAPAFATVATLCALLLTGTGTGTGAQPSALADGRPAPADHRDRVSARVDALYEKAQRATARYERVRARTDAQRATAARLRASVVRAQVRMRFLRHQTGIIARGQYRDGGWTPGVRLLTTTSPEALLERLSSQRRGDRALSMLLRSTRLTQRRLTRDRARAQATLRALETSVRHQRAVQAAVERRLARAERELRRTVRERGSGTGLLMSTSGGCPYGELSGGEGEPDRAGGRGERWVAPVDAYELSAGFASSGSRWSQLHTGQDFAVPTGTPVRAVGPGTVVSTGCGDAFGNQIVLRHEDGYYTQYAHLSLLQVRDGDRVRAGQRIGLSGNTGNSTGPHLHFEVRVTPRMGSGIDPLPWLRGHGATV